MSRSVSTASTMYPCPKCPKSFPTETHLHHHLIKNLPCDLKCRQCEFDAKDRFHYYRHQKAKHLSLATTTLAKQKEDEKVQPSTIKH